MTIQEVSTLLRQCGSDVQVPCHVQPRASRTVLSGIYGDSLKISLNAPPVDGKANAALCEFLAKKCGVSKSAVTLIAGETSRNKLIQIRNATVDGVALALVNGK